MLDYGRVTDTTLRITKAKLGLSSADDEMVMFSILAALDELHKTYGIAIDEERADHVDLLSDLAAFNYSLKGEQRALPRHLEFRINNLMYGAIYE